MLAEVSLPQVFEAGMLICFGVSWPVDILKCLRTRRTEGKSLGFMMLVFIGYCCGVATKVFRASTTDSALEMVTLLYVLNAAMVAVDACLYLRFRPRLASEPPRKQ
ncbi:MAG: hypothetical protein WC869_06420 [Phycisphaerae bacterium]|jgi:hypothetical protein